MTSELVQKYYTSTVKEEWKRLVRDPYHRLEFDTTLHFLSKYLPPSGLVLDAGGGPGRYTVELARQGYEMILLDLTPANLEFAKKQVRKAKVQNQVRKIITGSIVDLSQFAGNTFDAVISTGGPLSHVLDPLERKQAIAEFIRVAKPGAPIFVSVMSRLSLLVIELRLFQNEIELPFFSVLRDSGDYAGGSGFTACHFFLPEELRQDFSAPGLKLLEMAGLEGISSHQVKKLNKLFKNEKRWWIWLETHFQTCTHPSVVGLSEHMLIVTQKLPISK
jgi:ubiquinone/menaquinone biosynthesis C-methylase UbiE